MMSLKSKPDFFFYENEELVEFYSENQKFYDKADPRYQNLQQKQKSVMSACNRTRNND